MLALWGVLDGQGGALKDQRARGSCACDLLLAPSIRQGFPMELSEGFTYFLVGTFWFWRASPQGYDYRHPTEQYYACGHERHLSGEGRCK